MPKIPTFTATGSIEQLAGTTSNIKIDPNANIFSALKPVTDAVVNFKIKENDAQNKTEALKLENDFITDMQKVYEEVNVLENKEIANQILKTKSNALIEKYKSTATNGSVQTLFNNYALAEVQKGIFRTNTQISKNILTSLDNNVALKENRLLTTAFLAEGNFDYATLKNDLTNLYTTNYKGKIPNANLKKIIDFIPSKIEVFEATKLISDNPRLAFSKLNNSDEFKKIPLEERMKLITDVKGILMPEIDLEWKNFISAAADGKEIPFDMEFAKEILPPKVINKMLKQFSIVKNSIADTKILNSIPLKDLESTLKTMTESKYESMTYIEAKNMESYLKTIATNRIEKMSTNPVKFLFDTNDEIERLTNEYNEETNNDLKTQRKLILVEQLIITQLNMGSPDSQIKVMSIKEAQSFVKQYLKSDGAERVGLLKSLAINFGEHEDKAMMELAANGLPFTAQFSSFFSDADKTEKFLSFDEKGEQEILKQFLKDNDINFQDLRENIFDNIEDFNDAVMFANQFDTSIAADKLDSLMDLLAYYTANEMRTGKKESVAIKNASNLINENFDIHETYFVPRIYDGESLTSGQVDFVTEKAEKIQEDYLELFGAVSFKSKDETDVTILDEEMKNQLMKNGKWVNKADGSGLIYGIVFPDNSFAPVYNESGDALEFDFNDDSFTLPGTDIEMNFDKINIIPDDQAKLIDEENKIILVGLNDATGNLDFVQNIWSPYYQTSRSKFKEANAIIKLRGDWEVPPDAAKAINIASTIFANQMTLDGRISKEILTSYLEKIGQIETQYKSKKQKGNYIETTKFLARSYWQVEPTTAISLIKQNLIALNEGRNPLFGPLFEKAFRSKYSKGGSVLEHLSTLSKKEMTKVLEQDTELAAAFAAAKLVTKLGEVTSPDTTEV